MCRQYPKGVRRSYLCSVGAALFLQLSYDLLQAAQLSQVLVVAAEQWAPGDIRTVSREEEALCWELHRRSKGLLVRCWWGGGGGGQERERQRYSVHEPSQSATIVL